MPLVCSWKSDGEGTYATGCGEEYCLIEGTPAENRMTYCPNCGAKIEVVEPAPESEEE